MTGHGMFYWRNHFNLVEDDGPFDSIDAAKAKAVYLYNGIQEGFAFDIRIHADRVDGEVVAAGWIFEGRWIDGDYDPKIRHGASNITS